MSLPTYPIFFRGRNRNTIILFMLALCLWQRFQILFDCCIWHTFSCPKSKDYTSGYEYISSLDISSSRRCFVQLSSYKAILIKAIENANVKIIEEKPMNTMLGKIPQRRWLPIKKEATVVQFHKDCRLGLSVHVFHWRPRIG